MAFPVYRFYLSVRNKKSSLRKYKNDGSCNSTGNRETPVELLLSFDKNLPPDAESRRRLLVLKSAMNGNVDQLKAVIQSCPNPRELVNSQDLTRCTALHFAARFNQVEVAEVLLSYGADCNVISSTCWSAINVACRYQNENMVRLLLKYGCDPLQRLNGTMSVLHVIAMYCNIAMAEIIFDGKFKPPVNAVDDTGVTPLHNAAQVGNDDICTWLLQRGADPRAKDYRLTTPLMVASRLGHVNVMRSLLSSWFLKNGGDAQRKNKILCDVDDEGMEALHHAVFGGCYQSVQELLSWGANSNSQNGYAMCPLHICAVDGNSQLVPLLASHAADLSMQDGKGRVSLHSAVEHRNTDVIAALLKEGADINIQDAEFRTPLLAACLMGYTEAVNILCENGADLSITNFYGQTCLHKAIEGGSLDIFLLLLERCDEKSKVLEIVDLFGRTVLHMAGKQADIRFLEVLLTRGCSTETRDVTYRLPLHLAARHGSYETVLRLAEVTPDINTKCIDGKSPLYMACELGNRGAISALISKGANIKDTDFNFKNSLMAAASGGFTDIVEDLIKMGVQVNYKDKERNTALHLACLHGKLSTVVALLEHGACVSDINIHGQTPLDMAVDKSRSDVAVLLMEHSSWEESLSVQDKRRRSTLNRMIEKTPAAVKIVLDKCVRTSDHAPADEGYAIEFDYKYISADCDCALDSECVFVTMLDNEREDLLTHPLCQSNLSYKWNTFGKAAFVLHALLQGGFLLSVCTYSFMMPKPFDQEYMCSKDFKDMDNGTLLSNSTESDDHPRFRDKHMYTISGILYTFVVIQFCKHFYVSLAVGRAYIFSIQLLLSSVVSWLIVYATLPFGHEPCEGQWRAISYALFFCFLETSVLCQRLDGIGLYFTMFTEVAKTMIKISLLMLFFILAIAVPYHVMMKKDAFRNPVITTLVTFAMGLGEFNFEENFINSNNSPFKWDLFVLFPVCCIIVNCSLMNLMIGVAVGDISKVEKKAYLSRLKTHIYYLLQTERALFPKLKHRLINTKLVVRPNSKSKSFQERIKRAILHCEQISFLKKNKSDTETEEMMALTKELAVQKALIETLTKTTENMMDILQKMYTAGQEKADDSGTVSSSPSTSAAKKPVSVKKAWRANNI